MKKVLIVDDYVEIHEIFALIFEEDQLEMKFLTSYESLVIEVDHFAPDLLILDVRPGARNGTCLCDEVKSNPKYQHVKVALMSALFKEWRDVPCAADAKIDKPFDIDEVRKIVLSLLGLEVSSGNL